MNTSLNEWLEINIPQAIGSVTEVFNYNIMKFLYPRPGEIFHIRLIGRLYPYYRAYINPNHMWHKFTKQFQLKECMMGNIDAVLTLAETIIKKSDYLSETFETNWSNKSINYKNDKSTIKWDTSSNEKIDTDRISFLQSCMSSRGIWYPCVIANAYVKSGSRHVGVLQPFAMTKSMFSGLQSEQTEQTEQNESTSINIMSSLNISGINACDLIFCKDLSSDNMYPTLKIQATPNILTYDEISNIIKQKLINIEAFVKNQNIRVLELFSGFVYRPCKELRDASETLKILQQVEDLDKNEHYEVAEKELCNMPIELSNENLFKNGPISSLDID